MSYLSWRKDNEDRVRQLVENGTLEYLPAWENLATNELCDTVIAPAIELLLSKELDVITFSFIFGEYLFEEYHVKPTDIELFTQFMIKAFINEMLKRQGSMIDTVKDILFKEFGDTEGDNK